MSIEGVITSCDMKSTDSKALQKISWSLVDSEGWDIMFCMIWISEFLHFLDPIAVLQYQIYSQLSENELNFLSATRYLNQE